MGVHYFVDKLQPTLGGTHNDTPSVSGAVLSFDQAFLYQAIDALGHGVDGDERLRHGFAGAEFAWRSVSTNYLT